MRAALIAAAWLVASASLAQTRAPVVTAPLPAQTRANALPSGTPSILLSNAAGQTDLCSAVIGGGGGTPAIAINLSLQRGDHSCVRIRKAKALQLFGYDAAAVQVMCGDGEVRAAMDRAGTPCNTVRAHP